MARKQALPCFHSFPVSASLADPRPMSYPPVWTKWPFLYDSKSRSGRPKTAQSAASAVSARRGTTRCLLLHAGLVLIHLVLVVVWSRGWEHRVVFNVGDSANVLQTGITLSLSAVGVAYLAFLTYDTQRLGMRRSMHLRQTITALHDRSYAWLGLGSALDAIKQQFDFASSARLGVVTITAYLLCIFVLHNTTPALLNLDTFDDAVNDDLFVGALLPPALDITISVPYAVLPALSLYPQTPTPGLVNSTVYATLADDTPRIKDATVNASTFSVSCSIMPALSQTYGVSVSEGANTSYWDISLPSGPQVIFEQQSHTLRIPRNILAETTYGLPPISKDLIVMATFNVSGAADGRNNTVHLDPIMGPETAPIYDLSFLNCSLSWVDHLALVNATNDVVKLLHPPSSYHYLNPYNSSFYQPFDYNETGPWKEEWSKLVSWGMSASSVPSSIDSEDVGNITLPSGLGITEEWLMNAVGLSTNWLGEPTNATLGTQSFPSIQAIEAGLAALSAAMFWSGTNLYGNRLIDVFGVIPGHVLGTRQHLNISPIPLFIGLAASIFLTGVCYLLVRHVPHAAPGHKAIEGAGLLQWIYLFGHAQAFPAQVVAVDDPTELNLRRAGMQEMWDGAGPGMGERT